MPNPVGVNAGVVAANPVLHPVIAAGAGAPGAPPPPGGAPPILYPPPPILPPGPCGGIKIVCDPKGKKVSLGAQSVAFSELLIQIQFLLAFYAGLNMMEVLFYGIHVNDVVQLEFIGNQWISQNAKLSQFFTRFYPSLSLTRMDHPSSLSSKSESVAKFLTLKDSESKFIKSRARVDTDHPRDDFSDAKLLEIFERRNAIKLHILARFISISTGQLINVVGQELVDLQLHDQVGHEYLYLSRLKTYLELIESPLDLLNGNLYFQAISPALWHITHCLVPKGVETWSKNKEISLDSTFKGPVLSTFDGKRACISSTKNTLQTVNYSSTGYIVVNNERIEITKQLVKSLAKILNEIYSVGVGVSVLFSRMKNSMNNAFNGPKGTSIGGFKIYLKILYPNKFMHTVLILSKRGLHDESINITEYIGVCMSDSETLDLSAMKTMDVFLLYRKFKTAKLDQKSIFKRTCTTNALDVRLYSNLDWSFYYRSSIILLCLVSISFES